MPMVVALHGDGADGAQMLEAWREVADAEGFVLFAPTCPKALGCASKSWWRWYQTATHDTEWLAARIQDAADAVAGRSGADAHAALSLDPRRIYATGYSGGSSYLGHYVPAHDTLFAAVTYVAGGYPFASTCPACKLPVQIVIGDRDGMLEPYVRPLYDFYARCGGHDLSLRLVPGLGHKGMVTALRQGEAARIYAWFRAQPTVCGGELTAAPPGSSPALDPTEAVQSEAVQSEAAQSARDLSPPRSAGCGCSTHRERPGWPSLLAGVWWMLGSRRRATRSAP